MSARRFAGLGVIERVRSIAAERGTGGSVTLPANQLSRGEIDAGHQIESPEERFPRSRGECVDGPRPCPWVRCRHHLYLDFAPDTGSLTFNFPALEVDDLVESCALDVASEGPATCEQIGALLGVSKQAIQVVESKALAKLEKRAPAFGLDGLAWAQAHGEEWPEPTPDEPRGGGRRRASVVEATADAAQVVLPWGAR